MSPHSHQRILTIKNAQGGMERLFSVALNPAKPQFVTLSLDNVRLWNSKAEQAQQQPIFLRPDPPRDRIFRASFSRDGNYLIAGTISGLAQIRDVRRKTTTGDKGDYVLGPLGEPVYHIGTAGIGTIGYVGFSPAGDAFVTCAGRDFRKPDSLRF
jgi:WD40 repeat protein